MNVNFTKYLLNFNDTRSIDGKFTAILWKPSNFDKTKKITLTKSTVYYRNFTKNPLNFGETNLHSTNTENSYIGDKLDRLHSAYTTTTLTHMMTAAYKFSRYRRTNDPYTYFNNPHITHIHLGTTSNLIEPATKFYKQTQHFASPVIIGKWFSLGLKVLNRRCVSQIIQPPGSVSRQSHQFPTWSGDSIQKCSHWAIGVNRTNQLKNLKGNWFSWWRISIGSKKNNRDQKSHQNKVPNLCNMNPASEGNAKVYIGKPTAIFTTRTWLGKLYAFLCCSVWVFSGSEFPPVSCSPGSWLGLWLNS